MENEKIRSDLSSSGTQILVTVIVTAVFALIGFVFSIWFRAEAYPLPNDSMTLYPEEWAAVFFSYFMRATSVCFVFNIIALILAVYAKGANRRRGAWVIWLIVTFIVGLIFAMVFFINYPEDTWCIIAALVLFAIEPLVIFIVSTLFASDMWKLGYNPLCR